MFTVLAPGATSLREYEYPIKIFPLVGICANAAPAITQTAIAIPATFRTETLLIRSIHLKDSDAGVMHSDAP
jgi:hypothetical protein